MNDITVRVVKDREEDYVYGILFKSNPDNFRNKSMDEQAEITMQVTQLARNLETELWR